MAHLQSISSYLPSNILSNDQLFALFPDWPPSKIFDKTGIYQRHVASFSETSLDLAEKAALKLLDAYHVRPSSIDKLILLSQTPETLIPSSSCLLHRRLCLPTSCGTIDLIQGCSGYVYALSMACALIDSGQSLKTLLITSDTYTKLIRPEDKSLRTLFGDASTATLLTDKSNFNGLSSFGKFAFGTDGSKASFMTCPNQMTGKNFIYMNGPQILSFTLDVIPGFLSDYLESTSLSFDSFDYIIFHQANKFILDKLIAKCKIPPRKAPISLGLTGNTVSSSIPLALQNVMEEHPGDSARCLLCGFGVGLSWSIADVRVSCHGQIS